MVRIKGGQAVVGWKVTIGDSPSTTSVVTNREMVWADVPSRIILIMLYLADGRRRIIGNRDFYWHESDGSLEQHWQSGFTAPADEKLVVKDGYLLDTDEYLRAQDAAMADLEVPVDA